jgi:selenocysteine-specific elongation factor
LDDLRATLAAVLAEVPAPDPAADVRLWVDRCFTVKGTGTVVTGTLPAGTVSVGDTLLALGEDDRDAEPVRVRGVESLGRARGRMTGVARVALDLGGRAPQWLGRGSVLVTPDAYAPTRVVDVRIDETERLPEAPVLHVGSVRLGTHAHLLAPGLARVRLERPLPLRVGDAMILRDPGSRRLWGVRVLEPAPPPPSRRGVGRARVADLASHDGTAAAELRVRGIVRASVLRRIGAPVDPLPPGTVAAGDWWVAPAVAAELRARLVALVAARAGGLAGGVPLPEAARELALPDPALVGALVAAAAEPPLRVEAGRVTDASAPQLPPALERAATALLQGVDGFNAPDAGRIGEVGLDERGLAALDRAGRVMGLDD